MLNHTRYIRNSDGKYIKERWNETKTIEFIKYIVLAYIVFVLKFAVVKKRNLALKAKRQITINIITYRLIINWTHTYYIETISNISRLRYSRFPIAIIACSWQLAP